MLSDEYTFTRLYTLLASVIMFSHFILQMQLIKNEIKCRAKEPRTALQGERSIP